MSTAEIYAPKEEHSFFLGLRASALLEMAIIFFLLLVANTVFGDGNRFMSYTPHPFWVVVILMAVQYGTAEGVLAAILASLFLLIGNLPEQTLNQDMYEYLYMLFRLPILWLITAVIVGELRQRHVREREHLLTELHDSRERERIIAESYSSVKSLKEKLELKIAGQLRGAVNTFRAAKAIEKNHPTEVLQGVQELVRSTMQPEKFSVYVLNKDGLVPTITYGWSSEDKYREKYGAQDEIYKSVIGAQQTLCIANNDHQGILDGQGVLVGPLVDKETGEISGMLKIEEIGFLDLNLSTIETFHAICEWVGVALVNANRYQDAKEGSLINPDNNLMSYGYYKQYTDFISALGKRVGFSVNMILIQLTNADKLTSEQRTKTARVISEAVAEALRAVDMAFDYQKNGEEYSIVLPATNRSGAKIVLSKLEESIAGKLPKTIPADFALTTHTIHEA
ncbi:MAG: hypothetical protein P8P30_06245 [Rickettsiales bacterium]|nr:hypothetical protein [Rickettsiales bacterium]